MKTFLALMMVAMLAVACGGGKSMSLEQREAVAKIAENAQLAGTLTFFGSSEKITLHTDDITLRLGQPIMIVPRITLMGLEVDVYVIAPAESLYETERF